MTILLIGRDGQVGTEIRRKRNVLALARPDIDLSNPIACANVVRDIKPDLVINAAAYTAVDKAEEQQDLAMRINGEAPGAMARAAATLDIPFVHISTDYVYAGDGARPWKPADAPMPQNVYGRSKLAGDLAVVAGAGPHVILRTSWVFSAHGSNFVKTMLRLGREHDALSIVSDQNGGPTAASDIADAVLTIADAFFAGKGHTGIYHFTGAPEISWAGFAREIFAQAGSDVNVSDIATADYPSPATRPLNSRLDCTTLMHDYEIAQPDWRAALTQVLQELGANDGVTN